MCLTFLAQTDYIDFKTYENEFETMRLLFDKIPEDARLFLRKTSLESLQKMEHNENIKFGLKNDNEKIEMSKYIRLQGNQLFTAKNGEHNVLGACRLYNDAIFAALDTNSEELALGFANRAIALQAFGYYQQAYDDCIFALRLGYPDTMHHKILIRQAYCAIKLRNFEKARNHLCELQQLNLNSNFDKQRKELQESLEKIQYECVGEEDNLNKDNNVQLNKKSLLIVTKETKGRAMVAGCAIKKGKLIFTERASAFVAVGDTSRLCNQCGTVNFIPYPCLHCRGRVNYCSLKCQEEHRTIHDFECPGYRFQLFASVGIAHLALRIILDNGVFAILDKLKTANKTTARIWYDLTEGGDIWKDEKIPYAESLRMISHLDKMPKEDIQWFALTAHHLVVYLKYYTKYFKMLNEVSKQIDWELLTASLILRHIGQSISNGHALTTILPRPLTTITNTPYHLLNDKIWFSPWHLKKGFLHQFSNYDDVASLILPYLSLCNHSCVQSFQQKISGRYISTYALRDFEKGDEITNCYDVDYRKGKRSDRREKLQNVYYFDCQCENCLQTNMEDVEFHQFHQYRCDNTTCGKIFIPDIPNNQKLNWWQSCIPNEQIDINIHCTICGRKQNLKWYHEIKHLMHTVTESHTRRSMYKIFKDLENTLLGLSDSRSFIAMKLVYEWFNLPLNNIPLKDEDYCEIIDMLTYLLKVRKEESSVNSIEYVVVMTFLWDVMAQGKYKASKTQINEMLSALNIIADDLKIIFLNYYYDYIKDSQVQ